MESTVLYPGEESIIVYGSFERNGHDLDEQAANEDVETEASREDAAGYIPDDGDIYTGKPLNFLYSALLPVFNIATALFLL